MGKTTLPLALLGLALSLSGCQEQAPPVEQSVPEPAPEPPTSFTMACDAIFFEFTARTEDVQATLPPGYTASYLFGTDWVSLVVGECDMAWGDSTWQDVPLAWTKAIIDDSVNGSVGADFYTYEWLADLQAAPGLFAWLSAVGWPVTDASITQSPFGYDIKAADLHYTLDAANVGVIPPGLVGFGGGESRDHHFGPAGARAFDVEENQATVLNDSEAFLTAEEGVLSRLSPLGLSPARHPGDRFHVLQDWQFEYRLVSEDERIEPVRH